MKKTVITIVAVLCTIGTSAQKNSTKKPNVILMMCDDLGWGDVGFNGNDKIITPNIDRLAKQGATFNRFYSAGSVCSPTRASCLTGRNPYRMGIPNANSGHMKPEEITIPELLREEGYATGHFGKWHLGTLTTKIKDANRGKPGDATHYSIPTANGYDTYLVSESKVPTYDPMIVPTVFDKAKGESLRYGWAAYEGEGDTRKMKSYGTNYWMGEELRETENLDGDDSRVIMDRVLPFINQALDKEKPFYSTIWFHTPHLPLVASKEYRDKYSNLSYQEQLLYASITMMDEQVGRLWEHLESIGEADNTMLWFCSDNGPEIDTPGSSGPFRERKRSLYEGGVRVPAFVVWPNGIKGNQITDFPAVTSDYLLTIIDFLKITYPDKDRPIDGVSLKKVLTSGKSKRKQAIGFRFKERTSWVTDQYKLISTDKGATYELYDLLKDKSETNNIAPNNEKIVVTMKTDLLEWIASCDRSETGADY
jgi:arylsulfatase A-like enzyme